MRRCFVVLLAAASAGCSSTPSPDVGLPTERTVAVDDQQVYRTTVAPNAKAPIAAAPGKAFEALKLVYGELGIPEGTNDPATGRFGNIDFWKQRRLGNEAISAYL